MNQFPWNIHSGSGCYFGYSNSSFGVVEDTPLWCISEPASDINIEDVVALGENIYFQGLDGDESPAVFSIDAISGGCNWVQSEVFGSYFGIAAESNRIYVDGYVVEAASGEIISTYKPALKAINEKSSFFLGFSENTILFEVKPIDDSDTVPLSVALFNTVTMELAIYRLPIEEYRTLIDGRYVLGYATKLVVYYDLLSKCAVWNFRTQGDVNVSCDGCFAYILCASSKIVKLELITGKKISETQLPSPYLGEKTWCNSFVQTPDVLYIINQNYKKPIISAFSTSTLVELWTIHPSEAPGSVVALGDLLYMVVRDYRETNRIWIFDRYDGSFLKEIIAVIEPNRLKATDSSLIVCSLDGRLAAYPVKSVYNSPAKKLE